MKSQKIFIVDDVPKNIQILGSILHKASYLVSYTQNSSEALSLISSNDFDLILLDIMMPGITGYELCTLLKNESKTKDIPIIFLTAKTDTESIVKGFEVGAQDYITKPFNAEELMARVKLHLDLKKSKEELIEKNEMLKNAQKQLVESEKMASLGNLVAGVAHEINTPVGIGITAITTLEERNKQFEIDFQNQKIKRSGLESYIKFIKKTTKLILTNLQRTSDLVQSFKQVSVDQSNEQKRIFNLKNYLQDVILSVEPSYDRKNISISLDCDDNIEIDSFPGSYAQIFTNFIINSLVHGFDKKNDGEILIKIEEQNNSLLITYKDNGTGISAGFMTKIFDPFFTTNKQSGTGLGLHIVYNIVTQKLKGTIECESEPNKGVIFKMNLPKQ
ncbi:MAG: hybrid sensor histidine kinase/response regulator [Bacteroidetes bacterium]|nr:hybrid sensor histidine kinase/response regulator [Bacteroidota bacterium]MBT6687525.1 hybrid sensor histidine kinase/response regulator [Bacteroidota bacterium]MBT7142756.1 hybrid sensor histidine kinase/response regulator [Bacteroidota bacterium]MBT7491959.1 hybrid sensor histidine kinase/response regulator [Bacteroidota bacterium]